MTARTGSPQDGAGDRAGNLKTAPGRSYGYDRAERLTSVQGSRGSATLSWDPASRLDTLTGSAGSIRFAYDGADMIAETDAVSGAVRRRYVHGPGTDEPVVMYEYGGPSSFTRSWYLTDQKGSVTCLADSSGTSTAVNTYGYYGEPGAGNHGRYQYTGQVWLEELGLYYYKARFYDPGIKRFLNPDPAGYGDGLNMYAHVGGDPVNFRDPSGLHCTSVNTGRSFTDGNEFIVEGVRQCSGGSVRRRSSLGTNAGWWGSFFGSSHAGFNPGGGAAVIPAAANGDTGQEGNESPCKSYTLLGKTFDNSWRLQFLDGLVLQARGGFGSGARLGIKWGIKSNINVLGTLARGGEFQRDSFLGINPKMQIFFGAEAEIGIDVDQLLEAFHCDAALHLQHYNH